MVPEYVTLQDRRQVANLLSEKLMAYKNSNAIIVTIPKGGVEVGFHLAKILNIEVEIIPCRKIKHPGNKSQSIGAVSIDDTMIKDEFRNIPQDYICHQVILLQHALKADYEYYKSGAPVARFTGRTVIIVDDTIQSGDTMMVCLKSIKKQYPEKVIMAVPIATPEVVTQMTGEVDDFITLQIEKGSLVHQHFSPVTSTDVKKLLTMALRDGVLQ